MWDFHQEKIGSVTQSIITVGSPCMNIARQNF